MNFQMFKLDSEKAEELELELPTSIGKTDAEAETPILSTPDAKR